ncbi:CBL-interacting serine/threonine-protein kinase 1 [Capsicum annuum]|uniref:non-specific serine/threonine protein kinase n=1 Tax=Capsicum annuum TaxID=4072 RepID=A0A2G2YB60_CAPAN|nr:CBL-interacting serine/threonine-protein kinase 1 [Capsicum annuum]
MVIIQQQQQQQEEEIIRSDQRGKKGMRIGKYEFGRTLGQGNFGKVKYAKHIDSGKSFAIKILEKHRIHDLRITDQIKREIRTLKVLKHPNVVRLYEVLASKTKIYMVLEYVNGGELFDRIASKGKLSESQGRKLFQQLIDGVSYCHDKGVFHRDLKLENVLIDGGRNIKITDFGLSALPQHLRDDGLLHTTCGSPNYVAPEVLSNRGYDGATSDTWSCGVILYVILTGFLPFDDRNLAVLYHKREGSLGVTYKDVASQVRAVETASCRNVGRAGSLGVTYKGVASQVRVVEIASCRNVRIRLCTIDPYGPPFSRVQGSDTGIDLKGSLDVTYKGVASQVRAVETVSCRNVGIFKGDAPIPKWLSQGAKNLIRRILDPNPQTRITMAEIKEDEWFKQDYTPAIPDEEEDLESDDASSDDEVLTVHDAPIDTERDSESPSLINNAFQLIGMSSCLDLSGFFENEDASERKIRFTSNLSPKELLERIENLAVQMGFQVQKKTGKLKVLLEHKGQKTQANLSIVAEVFEISTSLYVVELQKSSGDSTVYRQLCNRLSDELGVQQSEELQPT